MGTPPSFHRVVVRTASESHDHARQLEHKHLFLYRWLAELLQVPLLASVVTLGCIPSV